MNLKFWSPWPRKWNLHLAASKRVKIHFWNQKKSKKILTNSFFSYLLDLVSYAEFTRKAWHYWIIDFFNDFFFKLTILRSKWERGSFLHMKKKFWQILSFLVTYWTWSAMQSSPERPGIIELSTFLIENS